MRAILVGLLGSALAHAAPEGHEIVPEDYFSLDAVRGFAVSSSGADVVFARSRWSRQDDAEITQLWHLDTRTRATTRVTHTDLDTTSPVISADDQWVYYLTRPEPDAPRQVFRARLDGRDPQQLTRAEDGVGAFDLPRGASAVWYSVEEEVHVEDAWDPLRDRWPDVRYAGGKVARSRLHRLDLVTWRDEQVYAPDAWIKEFKVSPGERHLALITAPDDDLIHHEGFTDVVVRELATGADRTLDDTLWRAQAPSPWGWLLGLDWSSDERALVFRVDYDGYPGETFVAELAGGEPLVWQLPRPREVTTLGDSARWVPGKRDVCTLAAERARVVLVCFADVRSGAIGRDRTFPEANVVLHDYAFSQDGRDIVALASTPEKTAELYRFPARGRLLPVQLTTLNPHTADWRWPKLEMVQWTAPDGAQVEGLLETPAGWTPADGPLPMVVQLHGGPTSHTPFARRFRVYGQTAFAAKGWALLSPNYRGSIGYGDAFLTGLIDHENDVEVADILSGVDAMVERGVADPDRLAVMGWSNGGYLTNALITRTDRFKAASSGAGVFDMAMQWSLEDTPGHVVNYVGLPWEAPEEMVRTSPLYAVHQVRTPTLLHVGEGDERVPAAHALSLHRALSFYLHVPTELVVYPGAGHSVRSWTHKATKLAWDHAWFERWVLGREEHATAPPAAP